MGKSGELGGVGICLALFAVVILGVHLQMYPILG